MFLFFLALCSLLIGILLVLRNQGEQARNEVTSQEFAFTIDDIDENPFYDSIDLARAYTEQKLQELELKANREEPQLEEVPLKEETIAEDKTNATEASQNTEQKAPETAEKPAEEQGQSEEGTSYDDELTDKDDEVESADQLSEQGQNFVDELLDIANKAQRIRLQFSHTVESGDKLKDVLELSGLDARIARSLIKSSPELANLKAGQQFYWTLDENGELDYLNWLVSEKEEQIFERKDNNQFTRKVIEKKGVWQQDVVKGRITGSFSESLSEIGLSQRQISQLSNGLQWQISTSKFQKGDRFAILVRREYINGKVTDLGNVEAIHIMSGGKSYYAIQADNGRYYSRNGETLGGKGFLRYPLQSAARISSPFNPRRLHPVTRRVAPHKGVDFGVPIGSPVIAPSDGVVEHIAYQAGGAGRYIKIRHSSQYTTVYMHLSKTLVKVGQSVRKGERIAISGNTGRSTGPHLHYEFHINGRPVNPMTVKLPGSNLGMSDADRKGYLAKARSIEAKLKL